MKNVLIILISVISSFAIANENFALEGRDNKTFELSIQQTFEEWGAVPYCALEVEDQKNLASRHILLAARQVCDSKNAELLKLTHFSGRCDKGLSGLGGKRRLQTYNLEISAVFKCI